MATPVVPLGADGHAMRVEAAVRYWGMRAVVVWEDAELSGPPALLEQLRAYDGSGEIVGMDGDEPVLASTGTLASTLDLVHYLAGPLLALTGDVPPDLDVASYLAAEPAMSPRRERRALRIGGLVIAWRRASVPPPPDGSTREAVVEGLDDLADAARAEVARAVLDLVLPAATVLEVDCISDVADLPPDVAAALADLRATARPGRSLFGPAREPAYRGIPVDPGDDDARRAFRTVAPWSVHAEAADDTGHWDAVLHDTATSVAVRVPAEAWSALAALLPPGRHLRPT